jgi:hypothetical protein
MNIKFKTYFILFITLIIGILLGILGSRVMVKSEVERILSRGPRLHFIFMFKRIIDPAPEQEEKINQILNKYSRKIDALAETNRREFEKLKRDIRRELDPLLTLEQKKRLDEVFSRRPGFPPSPPKGEKGPEPFTWRPKKNL